MPTVETPTKLPGTTGTDAFGGDGAVPPCGMGFGGPGGGGESRGWSVPAHAYRTGMWMALAAIVMLFAAFTSAMVVRKGLSSDWVATALPHILYVNTLMLVAGSVTLERARRSLAAGLGGSFSLWLYATMVLGLAFVGGQLMAWRELASRGVYLSTNPSSSFFYLLTAVHGVHFVGGIVALAYLALMARNIARGLKKRTAVDITAIYWHFMDGLWIYILILFSVRL